MSVLRVIFFDFDSSVTYAQGKLPELAMGDVSIFPIIPESADDQIKFKHHEYTGSNSYANKRKSKTILDLTADYSPDLKSSTLRNVDRCEIWVLSTDIMRVHVVNSLSTLSRTLDGSKRETETIMKLSKVFEEGGDYKGITIGTEGLLSGSYDQHATSLGEKELSETITEMYESFKNLSSGDESGEKKKEQVEDEKEEDDEEEEEGNKKKKKKRKKNDKDGVKEPDPKKAKPGPTLDWEANSKEGIMELITLLDPLIKYEGFSSKVCRETFIDLGETLTNGMKDMEDVTKNLLLCFEALSHIGNNITKLNTRRVDLLQSKKLLNYIENLGISKADRTSKGLTLPRIGIAFMPEYLLFRKFITSKLQSQTDSPIDVIYKDTTFYGFDAIRALPGYEDYHKQMSCIYHHKDMCGDVTDKGFLKSYVNWCNVSKQGFKSDTGIDMLMTKAYTATGLSPGQTFDVIVSNIEDYDYDR